MRCRSIWWRILAAVAVLASLFFGVSRADEVRIALVGDSTVCDYPLEQSTRGWGMYLHEWFKDEVRVLNHAASGRSTKTFLSEGRWTKALADRPAFVFIQMGHNDSHGAGRPEATDAATDYRDNLCRYVDESRAAGAMPVLITPMHRRTFNEDGSLHDILKPYADAMKDVAREKQVPLIDLHTASGLLVKKLGDEGSRAFANKEGDRTHFNEAGARAMASLVMQDLPFAVSELRVHLRKPVPVDVYLVGGQSNATGQGYMANLVQEFTLQRRVLLFHSGKPHLDSGARPMTWMPLRQASESPDRFGPELGLGNRLQELQPDHKIAIIKHAHSGTNLYAQWNPGVNETDEAHQGEQYRVFIETVKSGMQGLRDMGYEPVICGMAWQQGESDTKPDAAAERYGVNLRRFIIRIREHFAVPDMRFAYGMVLPPPNAGMGRDLVRQGERKVAEGSGDTLATPGAVLVDTDDLDHRANDVRTKYPKDHVHFGTAGTYELGCRMAEALSVARR